MCSCLFIEMNQTAHISLQIPSISNSVETKSTGSAPLLCGATRVKSLRVFLPRFPQEHRSVVPSGLPLCASAPPVWRSQGLSAAFRGYNLWSQIHLVCYIVSENYNNLDFSFFTSPIRVLNKSSFLTLSLQYCCLKLNKLYK